MRKTKTPRRSRLIRKWDGTPIAETEVQSPATPDVEPDAPAKPSHTLAHPELFFEMNHEDELTDTLDN